VRVQLRQEDEQEQERPEEHQGDRRPQEPGDGGNEPDEQEPELDVQGGRVRGAHEVEAHRLERRDEDRIARHEERRVDTLVQAVEEVERLGLRRP
jgi:hypothetical protein